MFDAVPGEGGNCGRNTVCLMQCPGKVGILWKEYSVFDAVPKEGGNSVEGIQCV